MSVTPEYPVQTTTEPATVPPAKNPPTGRWRIRSSFHQDNKKVLFSSFSEKRARRWMENRYPRGSEAYLEKPDGGFESYEHERADEYGIEQEPWAPFDPTTWKPPSEAEAPGQSAWGDVEG